MSQCQERKFFNSVVFDYFYNQDEIKCLMLQSPYRNLEF